MDRVTHVRVAKPITVGRSLPERNRVADRHVYDIRAALHVENYKQSIEDQAGAVVKRVASKFPYESADETKPCLKKESEAVTDKFIAEL